MTITLSVRSRAARDGEPLESAADAPVLESRWPKSGVPLEALQRSLYALADRATGTIDESDDAWAVRLHVRARIRDVEEIEHALRKEVNDQTLRLAVAARTDALRNLIFALAFSKSDLANDGNSE